tara:strand:- start:426 stop:773 length:348 start_codon:yes stop_codon:yes gene_type:complete
MNSLFDMFFDMKSGFFDSIKVIDYAYLSNYIQGFMKMGGIYVIYSFLHYTIPHIYTYFCVPKSIFGFFMSPLMAQSPHCIGLRWTLYTVGDNLKTMFALLAGWFYNILFSNSMRP